MPEENKHDGDYTFLLDRHVEKAHYNLFACGNQAPSMADLEALETEIGFGLPDDFKEFTVSSLGGLYIEVKEEIWPRGKAYDLGPFWSFLHGLYIYGISDEVPEWMDLRRYTSFREKAESKDYIPFMKIISDADVYCFGRDKGIYRWSHETGEFEKTDKTFTEILDYELAELKSRKEKKIEMLQQPLGFTE